MTVEKKYGMASRGLIHNKSLNNQEKKIENTNEISCDVCFSTDIVETQEGYTCRDCGIVLEIQKLEYYRPYNDDIIQHAVLGTTQIGSKRERLSSPKSNRLEKLNKLHSIKENKENVLHKARIEISRIFNSLHLADSMKEYIFTKFKQFRECLAPGTKYRSPEKLVPLTIYFGFKSRNISINEMKLLNVSKISKKEFNAFKLQILNFEPKYHERNRKDYIIQKIMEISEQFNLGMEFYYQSKKILYRLWESIKNTKDDVVAGVVSSISALCSFQDQINVNGICKRLGIKMSTVQSQVKRRIFERLRIGGFVSLVKSADLLKKILVKMSLLENENAISEAPYVEPETVMELAESPEVIIIELGNARQIFNSNESIEYYLYIFRENHSNLKYLLLKTYNPEMGFNSTLKENHKNHVDKVEHDRLFDLFLCSVVGPPVLA